MGDQDTLREATKALSAQTQEQTRSAVEAEAQTVTALTDALVEHAAEMPATKPAPAPPDESATPPCVGHGKPWRVLSFDFLERNPENPNSAPSPSTLLITNGTEVHPSLHSYYWKSRANWERTIKNTGVASLDFLLIDSEGRMVGAAALDDSLGADLFAFLACQFLEMGLHVGICLPGDAPVEQSAGSHCAVLRNGRIQP